MQHFLKLALFAFSFSGNASYSEENEMARKFALLIGNGDYDKNGQFTPATDSPNDALTDLRTPCNDVILIESKLLELEWNQENIIRICDADKIDIIKGILDFTQNYMSSSQPFGFVYYAGHGVQINDDAYIFGVDTKVDIDRSVELFKQRASAMLFEGGVKIRNDLIDEIGHPGNGSILLVIDACRDNPIRTQMQMRELDIRVSAPQRGAVPSPGLKMLFSTANGELASDGAWNNSPFAHIFARNIPSANSVDYLVRTVVHDVYAETSTPAGRRKLFTNIVQLPDEIGTLQRPPPDVCFHICG